jgi:hypothetical protein
MTFLLQNTAMNLWGDCHPYTSVPVQHAVTLDSRDAYVPETVSKILAAARAPKAHAPADKDKFLDWLVA